MSLTFPAWAAPRNAPTVSSGVALFERGEDAAAAATLDAALQRKPEAKLAAKAHIYLGLIRLNALRTDAAREEFSAAITLDTTVELPIDATPKAALLFQQARTRAEAVSRAQHPALAPAPADVPSPPAEAPAPAPTLVLPGLSLASVAPEEDRGPSHVLSLAVGGAGLSAVIVGAVFLGLSASSLSSARANNDVNARSAGAQTSARQQSAANWLLGAGAGTVVLAGVVFLVESLAGHAPAAQTASSAAAAAGEGL